MKSKDKIIKFKRISLTPPKEAEKKPDNIFSVKEEGEHIILGHSSEAHAYRLTPKQAVALGLMLVISAKNITQPTKGN